MFYVRSIHPEREQVEEHAYDLVPSDPQAQAVCKLFSEFLHGRPAQFRDKLSFLKKGSFELDWSAVPGGVALVSLLQEGEPAALGVLLSGLQHETDFLMLEVFQENVLAPLFGDRFSQAVQCENRPLLLQVVFTDPEWEPALHLLEVSLASVYFRGVRQAAEGAA